MVNQPMNLLLTESVKTRYILWIEIAIVDQFTNKKIWQAYAEQVIQETHEAWKRLIVGHTPCKADTHDISA
jgi:hypothetical protein